MSSFKTFAPVPPTATVSSRLTITPVPGITLELFHAPGESEDQLAVFWPDQAALFPADNIYRTFPNLYAIRGEKRCCNYYQSK